MIHTITTLAPLCDQLHSQHKIIVLVTGFFDLLHSEHINFLKKAKAVGDVLFAAIESDSRARSLKGEGRPIEPQTIRCQKVAPYADYVLALGEDFNNFAAYDSLMSSVRPNIYAVSSHTDHLKSKTFLAEQYGGKLVVVHDFNPNVSTTKIISQSKL